MKKLHRSEVEESLAQNAVDRLDLDDCINELKDIYINGFQSPPICFRSDDDLKIEWREEFGEEIEIIHNFEEVE